MHSNNVFGRNSFKGQFWSFDMVFAMVVFMAAITILASTWLSISNQLALSSSGIIELMQLQVQQVSQNLVSAGTPVNWQSIVNTSQPSTFSDVSPGLAASVGSSSISSAKLYTLISMVNKNYSAAGLSFGATYDYYINLAGGSINVSIGKNPLTNGAVTTFVSTRSAFMNGVPITIKVYIWSSHPSAVS
jgi:hypothetical protein